MSMALPLIHHGMLWVGLPYTVPAVNNTRTGGGPYGASHIAAEWNQTISEEERTLAVELGGRVTRLAIALSALGR